WFTRKYERGMLRDLDEVYKAYGVQIEPPWEDFDRFLRRQMKLDFQAHNDTAKAKQYGPELRKMEEVAKARARTVVEAKKLMREQDHYPKGVDESILNELDGFLKQWDKMWAYRWQRQWQKNVLGLVEVLAYTNANEVRKRDGYTILDWLNWKREARRAN